MPKKGNVEGNLRAVRVGTANITLIIGLGGPEAIKKAVRVRIIIIVAIKTIKTLLENTYGVIIY